MECKDIDYCNARNIDRFAIDSHKVHQLKAVIMMDCTPHWFETNPCFKLIIYVMQAEPYKNKS